MRYRQLAVVDPDWLHRLLGRPFRAAQSSHNWIVRLGRRLAEDRLPALLAEGGDATQLWLRNIRVNSINPGAIDTEGARSMENYEQVANATKALTPLGRTGIPEDIGLIAAFLASDEAWWLTGEIIFGSGGLR